MPPMQRKHWDSKETSDQSIIICASAALLASSLYKVIHLRESANMPVVAGPPQAHGPSTFEKSEH